MHGCGLAVRIGCRTGTLDRLDIAAHHQIDKKLSLLSALLLKAEKLLELIDQDAKMAAVEPFQRSGGGGNCRPPAAELADNLADAVGVLGIAFQTRELLGQIPQGAARRPHGASLPRHAGQPMLPLKL